MEEKLYLMANGIQYVKYTSVPVGCQLIVRIPELNRLVAIANPDGGDPYVISIDPDDRDSETWFLDNTPPPPELKAKANIPPCPRCGNYILEYLITAYEAGNRIKVHCEQCGYCGPSGKDKAAADQYWKEASDDLHQSE